MLGIRWHGAGSGGRRAAAPARYRGDQSGRLLDHMKNAQD